MRKINTLLDIFRIKAKAALYHALKTQKIRQNHQQATQQQQRMENLSTFSFPMVMVPAQAHQPMGRQ